MATLRDYIAALIRDRDDLAANLKEMGVEADASEKFPSLVEKVLDIETGGALSDITVQSGQSTFTETPADGYYGIGSVTVQGDENLVEGNIKLGTDILGVTGTYAPRLQTKTKSISSAGTYSISPDSSYDGLAKATVTVTMPLQEKSVSYTENGEYTISPDSGYSGMTEVGVTVDVPTEVILQSKSVTPGASSQTVKPDDDYNGLSSVAVDGDSDLIAENIRYGVSVFGVEGTYNEILLQEKSVTPSTSAQTVKADSGYDGLSQVTVEGADDLIASNIREGVTIYGVEGSYSSGTTYQSKTVTPTKNSQTVTADSGYNALAKVVVDGDSNLIAGNIAKGVSIFGITGTYSPEPALQELTVIPSVSAQYITPGDGYDGFSSVTVEAGEASGDYTEGYADGAASRDDEVADLEDQIANLEAQLTELKAQVDELAAFVDLEEEE